MSRQLFEFSCTNCPKIFKFKINTSLNGNYRIHCPNCGHIHFREVQNGKITGNRKNDNILEDIKPMMSSCIDFSEEKHEDHSRDLSGFMHRLWKERVANV